MGVDALDEPKAEPPPAPETSDPRFEVKPLRLWLPMGDDLTATVDTFAVRVEAPAEALAIDSWIDGMRAKRWTRTEIGFDLTWDVASLSAGAHVLVLAEPGAEKAVAKVVFYRTHPLYVVVSTDWDDSDNVDESLELIKTLKDNHPKLLQTQFVGPYTYTDPMVTEERRAFLTRWILDMRDARGDEIGVHIHPYCNFVDTTRVPCRTEPSTVYPTTDVSGYTVRVNAYTESEFTTLLEAATDLFMKNGLGRPTSFRAGGWTADLGTLRACENAGYLVESSALNWMRLEEWMGQPPGSTLYTWNMTNWSTIGDTSQPYYPSQMDLLGQAAPQLSVLEVPDNGILVDYVAAQEMIEILQANLALHAAPGGGLEKPTLYQIGYHPPNFNRAYFMRMDEALAAVDAILLDDDKGPATYVRLSDLVKVWKHP